MNAPSLRSLRIANRPLPKNEPRCFGRDCKERTDCKRYGQVLHENLHPTAPRGMSILMSMRDDNGVCRRKL